MNACGLDPRRLLGVPALFRALQRLVGAGKAAPRLVELLAIRPGERVLDIGCGTADILQHLPPDIEYHGFDVSEHYVTAARARFGHRGRFTVQAITPDAADRLGQFDVVMAIGVLHHLTDAEASALFSIAHKVLRPGGRVITCDGAFVPGQNPIAKVLLKLDRGRRVRTPEQYVAVAKRDFPDATARVINDLLTIPYTHCIVEAHQSSR